MCGGKPSVRSYAWSLEAIRAFGILKELWLFVDRNEAEGHSVLLLSACLHVS